MFIDATTLENNQQIDADICIVGAGAAGISMAREFIGTNHNIVVLESGGFELDPTTQSLYEGINTGLPTFDVHINRLRYFGGTTNHWAGHCRPLDPIDFERRDWIPHSGWPISRKDLEPFYIRAQPLFELGEYKYEDLSFFEKETDSPALKLDRSRLKTAVYNQSPPTRFGRVYRKELKRASNVRVFLHSNVLEFETNEASNRVTGARVACIDGPRFKVKAQHFVLATGGMENARLLLLSNKVRPAGLGNDHGLVGRYFMDHILLRPGADISFSNPIVNLQLYDSINKAAGGRMFCILAATEELMRKERIANFRMHLVRARSRSKKKTGAIFSDLYNVPEDQLDQLKRRQSVALHLVLEPIPNPNSRITLSDDKDLFGQPRLSVNWTLSEGDLPAASRALRLAALEFGRLGLGRGFGAMFWNDKRWPRNLESGRHHCGTTRMSDNASSGIVNSDCQVFGVSNLSIAGSSVFPTIGYANPTLTIAALAIRLADQLKRQLS